MKLNMQNAIARSVAQKLIFTVNNTLWISEMLPPLCSGHYGKYHSTKSEASSATDSRLD